MASHAAPEVANPAPKIAPDILAFWNETAVSVEMATFTGRFTRPTWANMLIRVAGALLSPSIAPLPQRRAAWACAGAATFQ